MKLFSKKVLYRKDSEGKVPYLIRWTLFQCRWFSVKLHRVLISDEEPMHDHPWSYMSFILQGGYHEHTKKGTKWYSPGSVLFRKADIPHRLEIPKGKTCLSLIFTSYKWRDWGFVTNKGWIAHKELDVY